MYVVSVAGRATFAAGMFTIVSAFDYLWGCAHTSTYQYDRRVTEITCDRVQTFETGSSSQTFLLRGLLVSFCHFVFLRIRMGISYYISIHG